MAAIAQGFATAFRDFVVDGVASSGAHEPIKSEIRAIGPIIESALGTIGFGALIDATFATRALLNANLAFDADSVALVYADSTDTNNDLYIKVGASGTGSWTLTTILHDIVDAVTGPAIAQAQAWAEGTEPGGPGTKSAKAHAADAATSAASIRAAVGKNLADPAKFVAGKRYSPLSSAVITDAIWRSHGFTELQDGKTYTLSGFGTGQQAFIGPDAIEAGAMTSLGTLPAGGKITFTAAAPNLFLWVNITNTGGSDTTFDGTFQIEEGSEATPYEPFKKVVALDDIERGSEIEELIDHVDGEPVRLPLMVTQLGKNLLDESQFNPNFRYSTASRTIVAATVPLIIGLGPVFPVEEGQTYVVSGSGIHAITTVPQGGFYTSPTQATAVQNITFANSPTGAGRIFTVPTGLGITHARVSLATDSNETISARLIAGPAQVEVGLIATAYEPYAEKLVIDPDNLPANEPVAALVPVEVAQPALAETITLADCNHILQIGQSLAIGTQGVPLINTVGWDNNFLTWQGGPKANPPEAGGVASTTASFKTLVEDTFSPDGGSNRGETGLWVAAHTLAQSIVESTGSYGGRGKFVFTAPGVGGQAIAFFRQSASGSSWWQTRFLPSIRRAKAIADAASETYCVPVIMWAQGEANVGVAGYAASLTALFDEMAAAVRAETGQTFDPHFITYQTSYATLEGNPLTTIRASTLAQPEVARTRARTHIGPIVYSKPHNADAIHLTAPGYAMQGREFGEILTDIIDRSVQPKQILFRRAFVGPSLTDIVVAFDAVGGGLVFDTDALPAAQDFGFRVVDDTGTLTLSNIRINGNEVRMTLNRALGANPRVRYGVDYRPALSPSAANIGIGNLRLSPVLDVPNLSIDAYLWCHQFIENIVVPTP